MKKALFVVIFSTLVTYNAFAGNLKGVVACVGRGDISVYINYDSPDFSNLDLQMKIYNDLKADIDRLNIRYVQSTSILDDCQYRFVLYVTGAADRRVPGGVLVYNIQGVVYDYTNKKYPQATYLYLTGPLNTDATSSPGAIPLSLSASEMYLEIGISARLVVREYLKQWLNDNK
jgi:hypothetical protein